MSNDEKILELKQQIQTKKNNLSKLKFIPVTNCSLELDSVRYNLHTINSKEQLLGLKIKLNMYKMSMNNLLIPIDEYKISGYTVTQWINDIDNKIAILSQSEVEKELLTMEEKLSKLLSNDKRIELELEDIANKLKI